MVNQMKGIYSSIRSYSISRYISIFNNLLDLTGFLYCRKSGKISIRYIIFMAFLLNLIVCSGGERHAVLKLHLPPLLSPLPPALQAHLHTRVRAFYNHVDYKGGSIL